MMTRQRMYLLTAFSAALFVFLTIVFGDGLWTLDSLFSTKRGGGEDVTNYVTNMTFFTYIFLALIIVAGVWQAQRIPAEGVDIEPARMTKTEGQAEDPTFWKLLIGNAYFGVVWLALRFYIGFEWLAAGEHKIRDSAWMDTGAALQGYWTRATAVPEGGGTPRAGTYDWYNDFLKYMLDNEWYSWFAPIIAVGEFLIGLGLILGALVGIAAFFGTLLNMSFMLAGSLSSNPVMFAITVLMVVGWKVAGYFGLDRYLLPSLGAPWKAGTLIHDRRVTAMQPEASRGPKAPA